MKIAIARQTYMPYGGAERFVERAAQALRERGTDITVIARNWQGEAGQGFLRCNPFYLGRTWRDIGFAHCVRKIIDSGRFDLVQSHERIPGCHIYRAGDGVHATWLEQRSRVRGGVPPRLTFALSPWHRYTLGAEAALFRHPRLKAVICNSAMVRDDIARRFGLATEALHVIRNGIDLKHFHPAVRQEFRGAMRERLHIGDAVPVILFVGSGFERKGIPALLAALARLRRDDALLLVVGRDRKEERMAKLAAELGIGKRVRFLGGQQDVRPWYACADLFCLPTLYDPMPNAALEALACGLPVVTSTTSGAAELIAPQINGRVCDALDIDALAGHIDAVLDGRRDPDAIAATVADFGIEETAEKLVGLYDRLQS